MHIEGWNMDTNQRVIFRMQGVLNEIVDITDTLYAVISIPEKSELLYRLSGFVNELFSLVGQICIKGTVQAQTYVETQQFTLDELSKYSGKGSNPAYVAVNGVVYDVTNNAAWAAATHFGLTAGKDYTKEFASCHTGQNILTRLSVAGRIANG